MAQQIHRQQLKKGKIADLVLLDANPLTGIHIDKIINESFCECIFTKKRFKQNAFEEVEIAANKK